MRIFSTTYFLFVWDGVEIRDDDGSRSPHKSHRRVKDFLHDKPFRSRNLTFHTWRGMNSGEQQLLVGIVAVSSLRLFNPDSFPYDFPGVCMQGRLAPG